MKMTCYPNSLDARTVFSTAEEQTEEAHGSEIRLTLFGEFVSYKDLFTTEPHKVCQD